MNAAYRSDTPASALAPVVWPAQPSLLGAAMTWLRALVIQPEPPPRSTLQTGLRQPGEFTPRGWL